MKHSISIPLKGVCNFLTGPLIAQPGITSDQRVLYQARVSAGHYHFKEGCTITPSYIKRAYTEVLFEFHCLGLTINIYILAEYAPPPRCAVVHVLYQSQSD